MSEFEIDPELYESLRDIRESVRRLFEQLRLKQQDGDVTGKDRLERLPALAKRNFRNLTGPIPHLAIKQAWRLVDFLEGSWAEARLSPRAREALRVIELDKQLATLRASPGWKDAAAGLRVALGVRGGDVSISDLEIANNVDEPRAAASASGGEPTPDHVPSAREGIGETVSGRGWRSKRIAGTMTAIGFLGALGIIITIWEHDAVSDPRFACLALESASKSALAAHWAVDRRISAPRPEPSAGHSNPVVFAISDPADGGPVRSLFTTSQFSFEEGTNRRRPGGGKADVRLRVGGWGDTYVSLLKFPIPDNRLVRRAFIRLVVLGDEPTSRPTTMALRMISDPWVVPSGTQHRLWWRNCPRSDVIRTNLPAPGPPDSIYDIDITDIYNLWARGLHPNHGIMLEPERIGSYGASPTRYANFSTFYSTRAINPSNRPRLILVH